ncbi:hypothetical protein AKJ09_04094 [Labilithrix luteola]|uniref:Uncharacterized protein n=1 Tax=Labilithrix luteola TaxID=1391654 RepID=A0A0K1PV71_9BACT|nr:hypothetical protein AKJ09_04094 [Labilithrix luteola]
MNEQSTTRIVDNSVFGLAIAGDTSPACRRTTRSSSHLSRILPT